MTRYRLTSIVRWYFWSSLKCIIKDIIGVGIVTTRVRNNWRDAHRAVALRGRTRIVELARHQITAHFRGNFGSWSQDIIKHSILIGAIASGFILCFSQARCIITFRTWANVIVLAWYESTPVFGAGYVKDSFSRVSIELIDVGNVAWQIATRCILTLQFMTMIEGTLRILVALSPWAPVVRDWRIPKQ